ncbi:MAG: tetratricopeptide repeat protein [Candidatus Binataceae bacterium]
MSLGLFAGALLSYDLAVLFPFLIAAHAVIMEAGGDDRRLAILQRARAALLATWPYALEIGAYLLLRSWITGPLTYVDSQQAIETTLTFAIRMIPRAAADYTLLLAMPWRAGPGLRADIATTIAWPGLKPAVAGIAAVCGAAFLLLRRHPHRRLYLFCAAWFLLALGPLLGSPIMMDRWVYFPSFGLLLMGADLAIEFARRSEVKARIVKAGAIAILIAYALILFSVQRIWHDKVTYWTWEAEAYPREPEYRSTLAFALESNGDLVGARHEFEATLSLNSQAGLGIIRGLARVDARLGDLPATARAANKWIGRLRAPIPDDYAQLAFADDAAGDAAGAAAALAKAAALPDGAHAAFMARAQIRFRRGDEAGAEAALRKLLRRQPRNRDAMLNLGMALAAEHRYDDAIAIYRRAAAGLSEAPDIHYRIARLLHQEGRNRAAREECAIALEESPNDPKAHALMAELGREDAK